MSKTLTVNEYRSISTSQRRTIRRGRNRLGQVEYGVQVDTTEGPRPLGLTILPFRLEQRGTKFLGADPIHYVRVYEDGRVERI